MSKDTVTITNWTGDLKEYPLNYEKKTIKDCYEADKKLYHATIWALVAFMVGLVASVALIAGGIL